MRKSQCSNKLKPKPNHPRMESNMVTVAEQIAENSAGVGFRGLDFDRMEPGPAYEMNAFWRHMGTRIAGSAVSTDFQLVEQSDDSSTTRPTRAAESFHQLASQWYREAGMHSSIEDMAMHPAYQQIIGMGASVIPLILDELSRRPHHWFWALNAISRQNPIPSEHYGKVRRMAADWIEWGRRRGYIREHSYFR